MSKLKWYEMVVALTFALIAAMCITALVLAVVRYSGEQGTMATATYCSADNNGNSSSTALVGITVDDYQVVLRTWRLEI